MCECVFLERVSGELGDARTGRLYRSSPFMSRVGRRETGDLRGGPRSRGSWARGVAEHLLVLELASCTKSGAA